MRSLPVRLHARLCDDQGAHWAHPDPDDEQIQDIFPEIYAACRLSRNRNGQNGPHVLRPEQPANQNAT